MSDQPIELTRRKALAALGTVGVASAGAGLGTTAYFSDEENFANNQLTAGSLDLKVDWEEHYSDWDDTENDTADGGEFSITMWDGPAGSTGTASDLPDGTTGFPTSDNWLIAVPDENVTDFMNNTSVEAYPDTDDDGIQDFPTGWDDPTSDNYICEIGADTPEDLDPNGGTGYRTLAEAPDAPRGAATVDENGEPLPLINIDDVKPGDFGELTLSTHLCDNDGYLWLTGELLENDENSVTEPEAKDPDEDQTADDPDDDFDGELADTIRVAAWYDDDGDNVKDDGEAYIVEEATLSSFLASLNVGPGLALSPGEPGAATLGCVPDAASITEGDADGLDVGDSVTIDQPGSGAALTIEIDDETDTDRNRVAFTGNFPKGSEAEIGDYLGVCAVTITGTGGEDGTEVTRDYGDGGCVRSSQLLPVNADIGTVTGLQFDLCQVTQAEERDCFEASNTNYIGFAWWLPADHGNEVQTDSVAFDLGFYTEQCRHNDGSGQAPETNG